YGTGYGGSPPNTSRTMRLPVSYEPPRVAWSLPKGSTVTPNARQRAGQSTRQVSLPACDTGAVALCPQVQVYETVLAIASKPMTRVSARRPHAAHRALYGDQSSFSALPVTSYRIRLIVSVCCSASIICVSSCPERYSSWARRTSKVTPSV